jgi:hypothetical protein
VYRIFLCVADKGGWGLLLKEIQVWAPGSIDKLYADVAIQDMKEITFGMESSKAAGFERILAEAWKVLVAEDKKMKL